MFRPLNGQESKLSFAFSKRAAGALIHILTELEKRALEAEQLEIDRYEDAKHDVEMERHLEGFEE